MSIGCIASRSENGPGARPPRAEIVGRGLAALAGLALASACTPTQVLYRPIEALGPETGTVEAFLYLVGDAGEANPEREEVLAHLSRNIASVSAGADAPPVVVAFLGDNIYEVGARPAHEEEDLPKLTGQIEALGERPRVRGIFVPGNHDWAKGQADARGQTAVRTQQEWIERSGDAVNVDLLPSDACPGPATLDLGPSVRLLFVDTEWLLREPDDGCGTADDFFRRLEDDLARTRDKRVIVMSHHPLASGGPHGGNVAPFQLGPLVYYLGAKSGVSLQDLASPRYSAMVRRFEDAFLAAGNPPLVHAGGHDHALQVIRLAGEGRPRYQLVSGSASRSENARRVDGTRYATNGFGYMRLDFRATDARLIVYAHEVAGGLIRPVFACSLTQSGPSDECPEAPIVADGH